MFTEVPMASLLFALLFSSPTYSSCDHLYKDNIKIQVANTTELCNSFYVVAYSSKVKGPIVSFERLNGILPAKRHNTFRPDSRLPAASRAELSDYVHSGYDRGHLTPAGDSSNDKEMNDTFFLSNITPQDRDLNEKAWNKLEATVRKMVKKTSATVYIATGAVYGNTTLGDNKIGIPVSYFKIVWLPSKTLAYIADNNDTSVITETTVEYINKSYKMTFPQ